MSTQPADPDDPNTPRIIGVIVAVPGGPITLTLPQALSMYQALKALFEA